MLRFSGYFLQTSKLAGYFLRASYRWRGRATVSASFVLLMTLSIYLKGTGEKCKEMLFKAVLLCVNAMQMSKVPCLPGSFRSFMIY